jgi:hypothetical protein
MGIHSPDRRRRPGDGRGLPRRRVRAQRTAGNRHCPPDCSPDRYSNSWVELPIRAQLRGDDPRVSCRNWISVLRCGGRTGLPAAPGRGQVESLEAVGALSDGRQHRGDEGRRVESPRLGQTGDRPLGLSARAQSVARPSWSRLPHIGSEGARRASQQQQTGLQKWAEGPALRARKVALSRYLK